MIRLLKFSSKASRRPQRSVFSGLTVLSVALLFISGIVAVTAPAAWASSPISQSAELADPHGCWAGYLCLWDQWDYTDSSAGTTYISREDCADGNIVDLGGGLANHVGSWVNNMAPGTVVIFWDDDTSRETYRSRAYEEFPRVVNSTADAVGCY